MNNNNVYNKCIKNKCIKFNPNLTLKKPHIPYNLIVSQKIQTKLGGSINYGNFYLGNPLSINYLGRTEGQPGGSGAPPKNKY
jgi:hypothetical protein